MINLIQPYKTIQQNGNHLIFYQYCVNALFSLVRLAMIIMHVVPGLPGGRHVLTLYMYKTTAR